MAKFGIPQSAISDNGPEFKANEFKIFDKDSDFQHDTSSTLYQQSNGLVEHTIQTIKHTMKNLMKSNQDPYIIILFNDTPSVKKR